MKAKAMAEATKMQATADYIAKENEAKGILRVREAEGLEKLKGSAGGISNLSQYLMIKNDIVTKIAKHQAEAVSGMNPKINIWHTGSKGDDINGLSGAINNIVKTGIPLLEGIKDQYGIDLLKNFKET